MIHDKSVSFVRIALLVVSLSTNSFSTKNAVLFLADDGGFEIGAYGNKVCQTPNIDKLASGGIIFTNAFSTVSSCSPSRSVLLTGVPQHQNGMYGLHHNVHHFQSFDHTKSIPSILRKHRIKTGIVGKKHVGPKNVYRFDFERTEEQISILQVGRNITFMKLMVRDFLTKYHNKSFFLYIAFHDPHRCGHSHPEFGQFCEKFGNRFENTTKYGLIEDWTPVLYKTEDVLVPRFVPDTDRSRLEISAQYTTISRMDQGIGVILQELSNFNVLNDTLIMYTSDNGISFPNGRTNLYDSGIRQPLIMMITSGKNIATEPFNIDTLVTHFDLMPTILDWFEIETNTNHFGHSLLSEMQGRKKMEIKRIFASHSLHEITMYYPMRMVRSNHFKLIHNLNYRSAYPIDQDLYVSSTFQELLNRTVDKKPLHWLKNLTTYYFRDEWEFFDLTRDVDEVSNLINDVNYSKIIADFKEDLLNWQNATGDPWICSPHAVLLRNGHCFDLLNSN